MCAGDGDTGSGDVTQDMIDQQMQVLNTAFNGGGFSFTFVSVNRVSNASVSAVFRKLLCLCTPNGDHHLAGHLSRPAETS